ASARVHAQLRTTRSDTNRAEREPVRRGGASFSGFRRAQRAPRDGCTRSHRRSDRLKLVRSRAAACSKRTVATRVARSVLRRGYVAHSAAQIAERRPTWGAARSSAKAGG